MNVENVKATRDLILASESDEAVGKFRMDNWHCGTAACIAGFANAVRLGLRAIPEGDADNLEDDDPLGNSNDAADFLGLDRKTAEKLFLPAYSINWSKLTPKDEAEVLDHLI